MQLSFVRPLLPGTSASTPVANRLEQCRTGNPLTNRRAANPCLLLHDQMTFPPAKRSKNTRTRVTMSGWLQNKSERRSLKILSPDFRLGLSTAALGFVLKNMFGASGMGLFFTILGGFFVLQTSRLRFCFGSDTFSVLRVSGLSESGYGNHLKPKSIQGGLASNSTEGEGEERRVTAIGPWSYGSIIEWRFWWPGFPLLAYFKETQTKETGQRHFIPMLMDGRSMYEQMQKNFGRSSQRLPDVRRGTS